MTQMSICKWYPVAELDAIPVKEGRRVSLGDHEIALFNLGTEYRAIDNKCPHKGGPLADGLNAGQSVYCPLHSWKISLESGCALSGGKGQVKTYPVKVFNRRIYVAFEDGKFQERHPEEPFGVCHSERSEESTRLEGKLRDEGSSTTFIKFV